MGGLYHLLKLGLDFQPLIGSRNDVLSLFLFLCLDPEPGVLSFPSIHGLGKNAIKFI